MPVRVKLISFDYIRPYISACAVKNIDREQFGDHEISVIEASDMR